MESFFAAAYELYVLNKDWINPSLASLPGVLAFIMNSEKTRNFLAWMLYLPVAAFLAVWHVVSFRWAWSS